MPKLELTDELQALISEKIEVAVKDRFAQLDIKIGSIQKCIDILSGDLEEDRRNLGQMRIDTSTLTQAVKELQVTINRLGRNIASKVADSTEQAMETAVQKVAENVEPAMQVAVDKLKKGVPLNKKKHWWQRLW